MAVSTPAVYERRHWSTLAAEHARAAGVFADPFARRRSRGQSHPVDDFLFTYYSLKPGKFKRWHPGAGVILLDAGERAGWRYYRTVGAAELEAAGVPAHRAAEQVRTGAAVRVDAERFITERAETVAYIRRLLTNTAAKQPHFGCFGMHEWAMAYKSEQNDIRHDYLPLRLGAAGTDRVVESNRIRCSHFDAYRFFMPQAAGLNELIPTRDTQQVMEQPACLHANMDLYKWAYKLLPVIDSSLVLDCFTLAYDARQLDMRAAPYDLTDWGYEPVRVETPAGKAEYVRAQRALAVRANTLRGRLLAAFEGLPLEKANCS